MKVKTILISITIVIITTSLFIGTAIVTTFHELGGPIRNFSNPSFLKSLERENIVPTSIRLDKTGMNLLISHSETAIQLETYSLINGWDLMGTPSFFSPSGIVAISYTGTLIYLGASSNTIYAEPAYTTTSLAIPIWTVHLNNNTSSQITAITDSTNAIYAADGNVIFVIDSNTHKIKQRFTMKSTNPISSIALSASSLWILTTSPKNTMISELSLSNGSIKRVLSTVSGLSQICSNASGSVLYGITHQGTTLYEISYDHSQDQTIALLHDSGAMNVLTLDKTEDNIYLAGLSNSKTNELVERVNLTSHLVSKLKFIQI